MACYRVGVGAYRPPPAQAQAQGVHAGGVHGGLDAVDTAVDLDRVGAARAEDGATARQDAADLRDALRRSRQPLKVKLLDQSVVAGIGNIYASEALFRARLSPRLRADRLSDVLARRLWRSVRQVLREAIARGSTVQLHWGPGAGRDGPERRQATHSRGKRR